MSPRERDFFSLLIDSVSHDYFVFPQMHLDNILWYKFKGQNSFGAFRHINEKSVDFVLCDKENVEILLAIELDDATHSEPKRIERDEVVEGILKEADLPLLRIRSFKDLSGDELVGLIREKIS